MKFIRKNFLIIILLSLSILTRFIFLDYPSEAVFDEVYFGRYTNSYFTHNFEFFLHPPFAEMIFAGFGYLFGYFPHSDFIHIGDSVNPRDIFLLRFMPALFGSLLPLLIYFFLRKIGVSKKFAFLGGLFIIFDNAVLVESRLILTDILLLFFGFLSIFLYLFYREGNEPFNWRKKTATYFILSIFSASFAFSIKWTALSFMGIIGLSMIVDLIKKLDLKDFILKTCLAVVIFIPTYYFIFWTHTNILYRSGAGDAYTSNQFQGTLVKNDSAFEKMPQWQKFIELNNAMFFYNVATLKATHPYSSFWLEWPFGKKPIWYWSGSKDETFANIYLMGNIIVWLMVAVGIIFSVCLIFVKKYRKKLPLFFWFLLIGYFANLLPYIFVSRVTFLYHYLPSLVFGIMILAVLLDKIAFPYLCEIIAKRKSKELSLKISGAVYSGILAAAVAGFLIIAPISYGMKISEKANTRYQNFINVFLNSKSGESK
ncbi:MAG: phospholipid carrier-dependent glycosyltransferase [Candidatus Nealsonbacteria bacterium]|nr:phospholipid carrier-dependent glycosyltransferase [Candidatus Nealsonbacteria bacterium]